MYALEHESISTISIAGIVEWGEVVLGEMVFWFQLTSHLYLSYYYLVMITSCSFLHTMMIAVLMVLIIYLRKTVRPDII